MSRLTYACISVDVLGTYYNGFVMHSGVIKVREKDWTRLKEDVESACPREACGLLGGLGNSIEKVYPIDNTDQSTTRFQMDPGEHVRALFNIGSSDLALLATYYSHPQSPSWPSITDLEQWRYPDALSLIWSGISGQWVSKLYQQSSAGFYPVQLSVVDSDAGRPLITQEASRENKRK